jgi:hypothetical protein
MVKGELSVKHAREGDDAMPMVKEDDAVSVVKEDDAMLVVNQDEALVHPFGDNDDWAIGDMSKVLMVTKHLF